MTDENEGGFFLAKRKGLSYDYMGAVVNIFSS